MLVACICEREFLSLFLYLSVCFLPDWKQVGEASVESWSHGLPYARERCTLVIAEASSVCGNVRVPRLRAVRFVTLAASQRCSIASPEMSMGRYLD